MLPTQYTLACIILSVNSVQYFGFIILPRIPWALARQRFFSTGINKVSLHAIETAAFVVILDDEAHEYDQVGGVRDCFFFIGAVLREM